MNACKGLTGLLFGHKFQPRYNTGAPTTGKLSGGIADDYVDVLEASKPSTYVHDVCVRCGSIAAERAR